MIKSTPIDLKFKLDSESSKHGIRILNLLWNVVPDINKVDAILDFAVAIAGLCCVCINEKRRFAKNIFPAPAKASNEHTPPSLL